jgi:hypothetical protein
VLKLRVAFAQLTKAQSLNLTKGYGLNHKSHKERVGIVYLALAMKNSMGSTSTTLELAAPTSGARGVFIPHSKKISN